ncbi:MAG: alkylation response protein AidB-like acyl-CoA dehydrogenase, partial [Myxococcota bacterium]
MSFALTDEQTLLVEMARRFADRAPTQAPEWTQIAELGWPALCIPEQYDGLAMGLFDLCLIQEQLGRTLRLDPVLSNALASDLLARAGTKEQQAHWLPAIAAGDKRLTVALSGPRSAAALVGRHASGWTLEAARDQVWDAQGADGIIVPTEEGLFLVEREAPGVTLTPQSRIDGRPVCRVVFRAVEVAKSGRLDGGNGALEIALDRATIALSAEMLGGAQRAFDDTLEYLRTRVQFGKTLGSFQALQHRAARLYGELA